MTFAASPFSCHRAEVLRLAAHGFKPTRIATYLGDGKNESLQRYISRILQEERRRELGLPMRPTRNKSTKEQLRTAAVMRGITVHELKARIVEIVMRDGLLQAVLDDA